MDELVQAGVLSLQDAALARDASQRFRVRIPRYYADLIDSSEGKACPIRRQAIPDAAEEDPALPEWARQWSQRAFGRETPWSVDAIGDLEKLGAPRITHRYGNRAIVHVSSACALYCRFCFRKGHLNATERTLYEGTLEPALRYLSEHPEIREVILTGGDPLTLPDSRLATLLDALERINTIQHVRIHSRMPVTLPSRLTPAWAKTCTGRRFVVSLVSHFNHPREWTPLAREALARARCAGIPLYNQTVLLKGVNDDAETLYVLFQTLYEHGLTPFYLHHPDWTPGTFHFRLPVERGRALMNTLKGRLSGPALPDYVLDIPGGGGKISLLGGAARLVETREDGGLQGALYEVTPPHTRERSSRTALYAEFWNPSSRL